MIQLYRGSHPAFKLDSRNPLNLRCVTKAQMERKAMEQDAVAVTVLCVSPCEFDIRDYIIVDGRPYFLNVQPKVTKEDRRRFQYDLTFEGGIYELGRVFYTMNDLHGWDYTGKLYDFCNLVVNEMNRNSLVIKDSDNKVLRYSGRMIGGYYYWYNVNTSDTESYFTTSLIPSVGDEIMPGEMISGQELARVTQVSGAWTLDFELDQSNGKPIETDEKMLTYDNHTCLAVMHDLVSQWEDWEFAVDIREGDIANIDLTSDVQCGGRIIVRRKATGIFISGVNTDHLNMAYGKKGGLSKITRESPDGSNIPSRIYFYGGTQNVPSTYRNTRICLPGKSKMESYVDLDVAENIPCEAVKVFDDIYPACQPFRVGGAGMAFMDEKHFVVSMPASRFFDIFAQWKDPDEAEPSEYGSYAEWKLTYGTGDANSDLERYLLYYYQGNTSGSHSIDNGFPKSCYLQGDVMLTFQTGNLAGHSFKVTGFEPAGAFFWVTLLCEGTQSELSDEPIRYFPNSDIMCVTGDQFIVEGCLMPASYVYANFGSGEYAAETLLQNAARKYIDELISKIKVGVEISQEFVDNHNAVFRLYDGMEIKDDDLDISKLTFKARRVVYDLLANSYKVEIDDGKGLNPWSAITQYVRRINNR